MNKGLRAALESFIKLSSIRWKNFLENKKLIAVLKALYNP